MVKAAAAVKFSIYLILLLHKTLALVQEIDEVTESRYMHEIDTPLRAYFHEAAASEISNLSPTPTAMPIKQTTAYPTKRQILRGGGFSSAAPIYQQSYRPSHQPLSAPTNRPSNLARSTRSPTARPIKSPTIIPTSTSKPVKLPTTMQTWSPTTRPIPLPATAPSRSSTALPTAPKADKKYTLRTALDASNFLDAFNFETIDDPTHGTVDYVSYAAALKSGIAKYVDGKIFLGVDNTTTVSATARGRKSLRLVSKEVLNGNNLLILDLDHMPSTVGKVLEKGCSIWPAFWTLGPQWPDTGEIDIIEYVNKNDMGNTALHTSVGCDMSSVPLDSFKSRWTMSSFGFPDVNCYVDAAGQDQNSGCAVASPVGSVGSSFNSRTFVSRAVRTKATPVMADSSKVLLSSHGGVYAMQWDKESQISTWYFPRDKVPTDLIEGVPKPDTWGLPYSHFLIGPGPNSRCGSKHFTDHRVVFDTTFCGDWAGKRTL